MSTPSAFTSVDELRFRLRGGLHEPGHPDYADACTLNNAMIDRRPAFVARCAAPDDVIAALAFARGRGLPVAVRGGGHSVAGWSLVDDGVVLDVRGMADVVVDPQRRVARVGGGATWAQFDRAAQEHGLATTGGRVSTTGVAGLTLGGGSGWLERKHGLTCDNLVGAELVTADGRLVRASAQENPELLWGLRGGGGNFGVVCSLDLALHPIEPEVLGGLVLHPADRARDLLALWRGVMRDAPDGLSLAFVYLVAPDEPEIPQELRGRWAAAVAGMYAGPVEDGEAALAEIRSFGPPAADFFGPTSYADFQCSLDDPPGFRNWWTAENLVELPDAAIDAIVSRWETVPESPSQLFIAAWGGEIARVARDSSPLAGRDTRYVVHPLMMWDDPGADERMIAIGRALRADVRPYATGEAYGNFIGDEGDARVRAGFGAANHDRLAALKSTWDPGNVFHANQNVRPAPAEQGRRAA
jgi:FAD/FMN-containing dehydrogenase